MHPPLGNVGLWTGRLQQRPTPAIREIAAEIDELGYGALWVPESPGGRDVLSYASLLLSSSPRIPVATGIAIIWVRDAVVASSASRTLAEAFPSRFVLGLGVSHRSTAVLRGHEYERPLSAMRTYLEAMAEAPYDGYPHELPPILLAALGPKMIRLAADLADGAHPFLASVRHTQMAREVGGPTMYLAPELGVIPTEDPELARGTARAHMPRFLDWPNYRRHLNRMGYGDEDFLGGGSDRLVDDLFAWGSEDAIRERVDDHLRAGADHVAVQIIPVEGGDWMEGARRLAPVLLG